MRRLLLLTAVISLLIGGKCYAEELDIINDVSQEVEDVIEDNQGLDVSEDISNEMEGETPTVSGNDISVVVDVSEVVLPDLDVVVDILSDIQTMMAYTSYNGNIPEPYYSYMKDVLSWKGYGENYVGFVSSYQYGNNTYSYYVIAVGNITYNGSSFIGSNVRVYRFYPNTNTGHRSFEFSQESSFSLVPSGLVFTDLSSNFPDMQGHEFRIRYAELCLLGIVISFYVIGKFFPSSISFRRRPRRGGRVI